MASAPATAVVAAPAAAAAAPAQPLSALEKLLRLPTVKGKDGVQDVAVRSLVGKVILVYFGASWCPACVGLKPRLTTLYRDMKAIENKEPRPGRTEAQRRLDPEVVHPFELLYVSADVDPEAHAKFSKEMPWLSVDFKREKDRDRLGNLFRISSYPTVAVINEAGAIASYSLGQKLLDENARANFPWVPPNVLTPLKEVHFMDRDPAAAAASGKPSLTPEELLKHEYVVLYFGSIQHEHSRKMTGRLASVYSKIKSRHSVEFVFVGIEREAEEHASHWGELPFPGIVFRDGALQQLVDASRVKRYGAICVVRTNDGTIVNADAGEAITADPNGENFPWSSRVPRGPTAKAYWALVPSPETLDAIHAEICIIFTSNGSLTTTASQEFERAAVRLRDEWNTSTTIAEEQRVRCYMVPDNADGSSMYGSVLNAVGALRPPAGSPSVLLLNVVEHKHVFVPSSDLSDTLIYSAAVKFAEGFDPVKLFEANNAPPPSRPPPAK